MQVLDLRAKYCKEIVYIHALPGTLNLSKLLTAQWDCTFTCALIVLYVYRSLHRQKAQLSKT